MLTFSLPTPLRNIIILPFHLCLELPNGFPLHSGFPLHNRMYLFFLFSHMCYNHIPDDRTAGPIFHLMQRLTSTPYTSTVESCNWPATPTGCWTSCPAGRQAPSCTSARQLKSERRVRVRIGGATTSAHPAGSCSNYRKASHVPAVYIVFWQTWLYLIYLLFI